MIRIVSTRIFVHFRAIQRHRIREACVIGKGLPSGERDLIGGKERNKHASKKLRAGRGAVGKQPVIGMRERNGPIRAMPVNRTNKDTLQPAIRSNVRAGSTIYTDEHKACDGMPDSAGDYINGAASTNGIESFRALPKRGYYGTHHWWSVRNLHRYVTSLQH